MGRTPLGLALGLFIVPASTLVAQEGNVPLVEPGTYDFAPTPLQDTEVEVRGIIRPDSPEADTGFVYMRIEDFLSDQRPAVRITWMPMSDDIANMDLMLIDPSSYAVRYRLEPREGGAYGIYWYGEGGVRAAQVGSAAHSRRDSMDLERPVFSVPTLPWVLAQLSSRVEDPVRIEVPGFRPDRGGRISTLVLTPGERFLRELPDGGSTYPVREMSVAFESGVRWRYLVSDEPPYLLGITGWNAEGTETFRFETLEWAEPALDRSRRIPLLLRQSFIDANASSDADSIRPPPE